MSVPTPSSRRYRQAMTLIVLSVAVLASGIFLVWQDATRGNRPTVTGPVVENWESLAASVRQIRIQSAETQFTMERYDSGWRMPSRGGYPVNASRIAELDQALRDLQYETAMTRNEAMFDRLSLGDPSNGGDGVRVSITGEAGTVLVDLIVGKPRNETGVYLRPAGGPRAYAVSGTMPELADPGYWLGLDFMNLDPGSVARARVVPSEGPGFELARAGLSARNYDLRSPRNYNLTTAGAANGVAIAGARVRFRDVRPASETPDLPAASHAAVTFSGLAYAYTFFPEGRRYWARLEVSAVSDDVNERADRLSGIVEGWEFEVSEDAYERMTRPLSIFASPG